MKLISNHYELAMSRLAEEFRGIPEIAVYIKAKARQTQDQENAIFGLLSALGVDNANAYLLGIYAKIVGLKPSGRALESLRSFVRARILLNRSSGTIPELLAIVKLLVPSNAVTVVTQGKASEVFRIDGVAFPDADAFDVALMLGRGRVGGVRGVLEWSASAPEATFDLDDATGATASPGLGLGDASDPSVGGALSSAAEATP